MTERAVITNHRATYLALVASLRKEFEPAALEALWIQLREHRYSTNSLGVLVQAVHDARDVAYVVNADLLVVPPGAKQRILDRYEDTLHRQGEWEESQIAADICAVEYQDWILPTLGLAPR